MQKYAPNDAVPDAGLSGGGSAPGRIRRCYHKGDLSPVPGIPSCFATGAPCYWAIGFDEFFGLPYSNDMWPFHPVKRNFFPDLPLLEGAVALLA
jgi:hypothetical protein